jgi:methionyl-tRNA formyltransferase
MTRAFDPWPSAHTTYRDQPFKVLRAQALAGWRGTETHGQVIVLEDGRIAVATGAGALVLQKVQPAGKKAMPIDAFCRGYCDFVGSVLG